MTTKAAAAHYLARHLHNVEGRQWEVFNPLSRAIEDLPIIYGFYNGGEPGWYTATLISEDGFGLGSHICSHEGYMEHDLGILCESSPNRHKTFREYYPGGYRMKFIGSKEVDGHEGLDAAYLLNQQLQEQSND